MSGDRSNYRSPYASPDLLRAQLVEALARAERAEAERDHAQRELLILNAGIQSTRRPRRWQLP